MDATRIDTTRRIAVIVVVAVVALVVLIGVVPMIRGDVRLTTTDFDVGGSAGETGSFSPGELVWIGTNTLNFVSDGKAVLVDLVPLGLPTNVTTELLYMPIAGTQGALGVASDRLVPTANRQNARPLRGVAVSRQDGYFQLLLRFAHPAGGITVHGYLVTYTVDGETRHAYVSKSQHLCDLGTPAEGCPFVDPYL